MNKLYSLSCFYAFLLVRILPRPTYLDSLYSILNEILVKTLIPTKAASNFLEISGKRPSTACKAMIDKRYDLGRALILYSLPEYWACLTISSLTISRGITSPEACFFGPISDLRSFKRPHFVSSSSDFEWSIFHIVNCPCQRYTWDTPFIIFVQISWDTMSMLHAFSAWACFTRRILITWRNFYIMTLCSIYLEALWLQRAGEMAVCWD